MGVTYDHCHRFKIQRSHVFLLEYPYHGFRLILQTGQDGTTVNDSRTRRQVALEALHKPR